MKTLIELATEVERQASNKKDFLAPSKSLSVHLNGGERLYLGEAGDYGINEIAHTQLAEYTGIPKPFYDRLRNKELQVKIGIFQGSEFDTVPLYDSVVNTLLEQKDEKRLVRILDGNARAILSDKYNPDLDHYDLLKLILPILQSGQYGELQVQSSEVTERRLYLKVVSPRVEAVVLPENVKDAHGHLREPQVVQAGFIISNSEVGLGSLSVKQTVFKLVCTNTWVAESAYRTRHVGASLTNGDDGEVYKDDTRKVDAHARLLKARDHISAALDETKFHARVEKMQGSTEAVIEGKIEKVVEVTSKKFGLNQGEQEGVLRSLIENAPYNGLTLWGLSNAVTDVAKSAQYDRGVELEVLGGSLIDLPRSDWRELNAA